MDKPQKLSFSDWELEILAYGVNLWLRSGASFAQVGIEKGDALIKMLKAAQSYNRGNHE